MLFYYVPFFWFNFHANGNICVSPIALRRIEGILIPYREQLININNFQQFFFFCFFFTLQDVNVKFTLQGLDARRTPNRQNSFTISD